jgi:peptide-methionine (S)-S-oxide reductase
MFAMKTPHRLVHSLAAALLSLIISQAMAQMAKVPPLPPGAEVATFAGGCFWCMEPPYDRLDGVYSTISGYMGGQKKNPTYEEVSAGRTGHTEVVQVTFDPKRVSFEKLLETFWMNIDPTVKDRQFCDAGSQYRSEIFWHSEAQRDAATKSKEKLDKNKPFNAPIVTPVTKAAEFWPAEEYHQDYYKKNPIRYNYYRSACGRDGRLKELWGAAPK